MRQNPKSCGALGGGALAVALAVMYAVYRLITGSGGLIPTPELPTPVAERTSSSDWATVYFVSPQRGGPYRGGPDEALAQAIEGARVSVDAAIYDLNLWSIRDALLAAHRRGVAVRVVAESDNLDEPEFQALKQAGIPVLGDRREGLMHNKFVVIDRSEVWTGSMNYTVRGAYTNDNNLIRLQSSRLAQDYTAEFEEMFVDDAFGPTSPANTPYPTLSVDGVMVEVYFSPEDDTLDHLLDLVTNAQQSVYFLAFSFTSDDLSTALISAADHGITVAGVMERSQYERNVGTEYDHFRQAGLDVRLDGNPANMHHKVLIIDEQIVVTGSYNFTNSAEKRNDENTLILHDPTLAQQYLAEFWRVYNQAQP